jgi:hypothetical protein
MHKTNSGRRSTRRRPQPDQSAQTPRIFREQSNYVISTGGSSVVKGLSSPRGGLMADELIDIIAKRPTKA